MTPHPVPSLATASLLLLSPAVTAGEPDAFTPLAPAPAPASDAWEFTLAPYGFLGAIDGTISVGPISADIDQSLGDVLDNLDMMAMLFAQARKGRFALSLDLMWAEESGDRGLPGPLGSTVGAELDLFIVTGLASYRVWEAPEGSLELGAGLRVFDVDADLETRGPGGGLISSSSRDVTVVDGLVAARLVYRFAPKWSLRLYGDIGAGDSDLTWQAWLNLGYAVTDNVTVLAGYRHLSYEFEEGATDFDLSFSGPQIGVAIDF